MAAKKASKKGSYYPTVRSSKLAHVLNALNIRILHVDRALSRLNRRLYRQSRYYSVKVDLDNDDVNQYRVFALRDDWAVQKSYRLAREAYWTTAIMGHRRHIGDISYFVTSIVECANRRLTTGTWAFDLNVKIL